MEKPKAPMFQIDPTDLVLKCMAQQAANREKFYANDVSILRSFMQMNVSILPKKQKPDENIMTCPRKKNMRKYGGQ